MKRVKPHECRLLTGQTTCADCGLPLESECHRIGAISSDLVEAVEFDVGMGAGAWDMVDPRAIIEASVRLHKEWRARMDREEEPAP